MLYLMLLLNFVISWFNAWSVGKSWIEAKSSGGWARALTWSGAIMSASGFTWVYLALLALIAQATGKVPHKYTDAALHLGYLAIILPIIGSGLVITAQSWAHYWRERTFTNAGFAGWNTFAQVYNMYEATSMIPESIKSIAGTFNDDDDSAPLTALVVLAVVGSLFAGILTAIVIIRRTMSNHAGDMFVKYELKRTA